MKLPFMKHIAWCLIFAALMIGIAPRVDAGFISSELVSSIGRQADMDRIRKALEVKKIESRFGQLGFSKDEIISSLSRLSDGQLHDMAVALDELRVGGDAVGILLVVVLAAVLAGVIFKITGKRAIVVE